MVRICKLAVRKSQISVSLQVLSVPSYEDIDPALVLPSLVFRYRPSLSRKNNAKDLYEDDPPF